MPAPADADTDFLAKLTVLYVEDERIIREHLSQFLSRRVGRLLVATNGAEGLERFQADRPALIITDIRMPEMDGLSMLEEIRRLDAAVPVIVTTAFEQVDYLKRSIDVGVDRYVTKPVTFPQFEAAILTCVRRLRAEAALAGERQRELERLQAHEREALGLLAGGMAHDFNNLLQAILGNLFLALELQGDEQRELLEAALDSTQEARTLGRHLLTLAEGIRGPFTVGPVEPALRSALDRELLGGGITLDLELAPGLPAVRHDMELLGRVFSILAKNAREAMKDQGVLSVEGSQRLLSEHEVPHLPGGRYLQLTFRDTGPGIAPENLGRIFDPYFSTKPRGSVRGLGLGLALCQAILRQHLGQCTVESKPGEGAAFTILLPTVEPAAPVAEASP